MFQPTHAVARRAGQLGLVLHTCWSCQSGMWLQYTCWSKAFMLRKLRLYTLLNL